MVCGFAVGRVTVGVDPGRCGFLLLKNTRFPISISFVATTIHVLMQHF